MLEQYIDKINKDLPVINNDDVALVKEILDGLHCILKDNSSRTANLDEIRIFIKDKLQKGSSKLDKIDLFFLKNKILSTKKFPEHYRNEITLFTWKLLPKIASFNSIDELENLLSYTLHVKVSRKANDKSMLVKLYKTKYEHLVASESEKQVWFEELARRTFAAATKDDISSLLESGKNNESTFYKKQNQKRL